MLVLLLIEPRSSSPAMLLTELSQHSRFEVARTMEPQRDRQAQSIAAMKRIMCTELWLEIVLEEREIGRLR
jgi:hypothetical protein